VVVDVVLDGIFHENLGAVDGVFPRDVGPGSFGSPLCLVRFDGASIPTVVLGVGGPQVTLASAMAWVVAVTIDGYGLATPVSDEGPAGTGGGIEGQQLVFDGGRPLLLGADGAFGYQGAFTTQPPVVVDFSNGRFVTVTRSYPSLVAGSASAFWKEWRHAESDPSSFPALSLAELPLVAWAAVTCAGGDGAPVRARLGALEKDHVISASFVASTEEQLVATGYCPA
jgi:hypothetical protein